LKFERKDIERCDLDLG